MNFPWSDSGRSRRSFLQGSTALALAGMTHPARTLLADDTVTLPFENGERPLVKYPQKRPLIRLTARPPQLETPFSVFNESLFTPNDAFFVRYHLTSAPPARELLSPDRFRLLVKGSVTEPLTLSVAELQQRFENVELAAVNQCSGNSRGFFQPRVPGGQLGNGAMGCARWRGVRLKNVLEAAGLSPNAKQVLFNGLDRPLLPQTPDFIKAIDVDLALDPDLLLAWDMNGEALPWLNGFPLRLVVPGYYGTYWIKQLNEITVVDETFKGYWMDPAYRIPDDACAHVEPGTTAKKTVPITRLNVRSFITSLADGTRVKTGASMTVRGIAFDGGYGIREVAFSDDDGRTWRAATLGKDEGKYAFREWTIPFTPNRAGKYTLLVRATNRLGQSQPLEPLWNPAGYMRNVVEAVQINAA
ncbi:MAG TPA: oxidase [Verrucomicrobiales bacterium]|nr:oxidase [Verrucomicrobiales bacterium]